ncbi:uncharacterized protein LOC144009098 isoform X2 [Festucalex cinctus]
MAEKIEFRTLLLDGFVGPSQNSGSLVQTTCDAEDPTTCVQRRRTASDVAHKWRERNLQNEKVASDAVEADAKLAHLQSDVSCLRSLQRDNMKEIAEKDLSITKMQASILLLQQEVVNTHAQLELSRKQTEQQSLELSLYQQKEEILLYKLKTSDANAKRLEEATASLRAAQDSLRRTSVRNEERTRQLLEDNARLQASLAALQSQTSERAVNDIRATPDRARVRPDAERQMRRRIHEQYEHAGEEVACLQRELANVRCDADKKEKDLEILSKERDDLRAKMEDVNSQHGQLICTKDSPEADFAVCREELHACHFQLATSEKEFQTQQVDLDLLQRRLNQAREEFEVARLQAEEQKGMAAIFKHKYAAAVEKVHEVQGPVKRLAEELRYSRQQLRESQQARHLVRQELSELKRRHDDKVGQWERSQEALRRLTDELHVGQNALTESQQTAEQLRSLAHGLRGQADALEQQKVMLECDLRLYQQSHSHADDDYLSLQSHEQKLQKRCSEQVERLVECEKFILQMKSELERQNHQQASVKKILVISHRAHLKQRAQLEQEVAQLKEEVAHFELELSDSQKGCVNFLRQSEEALQDAKREAARSHSEVDVLREEVRRLEDGRRKEEEKLKSADGEKQSLSTQVGQLSQELAQLRCKHQTTVELLAARSEEAKRMAACLKEEEEQAQDKTRVMTRRLELEVAELKRNLQQTDMDKKHAQAQVDTLQSELAASCSHNDSLRHESRLVVTNLKRWITEQERLQEANDTLTAEVKRLKEATAGQEKELGSGKAQLKDVRALQDQKIPDAETCMNLGRLADMQTKLQRNMDAISLLNQQLKALSEENKHLRRQLVACHHPPTSVRLPSSSLPPPPSLKQATRGIEGI